MPKISFKIPTIFFHNVLSFFCLFLTVSLQLILLPQLMCFNLKTKNIACDILSTECVPSRNYFLFSRVCIPSGTFIYVIRNYGEFSYYIIKRSLPLLFFQLVLLLRVPFLLYAFEPAILYSLKLYVPTFPVSSVTVNFALSRTLSPETNQVHHHNIC